MCVNGDLIGTRGRVIEWTYPRPHVSPKPKQGVEKTPFQIATQRLEIDENANRPGLI